MTEREALKLALEALETGKPMFDAYWGGSQFDNAITAIKEVLAQPEQEPVAWPCVIAEADFSQNTVTLTMQCTDYKVSSGKHWLCTTPPQRKPLTDEIPKGVLLAISNAGLTLLKTQHGYELRKLGPAIAHGIKGDA